MPMDQIRSFDVEGETWYCANDVALMLGYTQPAKDTSNLLQGMHQQKAKALLILFDAR